VLLKIFVLTKQLTNFEDIKLLVDTFYSKIRKDELLGHIFELKIQDKWNEHLQKMYTFWQTLLFDEHTYFGRPFPPHAELDIEKKHFDRWISIFYQTVDELFEGKKVDEIKWRADRMAKMFLSKIEYFKTLGQKPLK